jgi:hypothetical protein
MNAIMTDFDFKNGSEPVPQKWEGLAELDRALVDNRLTEYRLKKAWADPLSRRITIGVLIAIVSVFVFLAGASFRFW